MLLDKKAKFENIQPLLTMTDTSSEIKQKQLEIWLSKTPAERLRITLEDNDALFKLWDVLKKNYQENKGKKPSEPLSSPVFT